MMISFIATLAFLSFALCAPQFPQFPYQPYNAFRYPISTPPPIFAPAPIITPNAFPVPIAPVVRYKSVESQAPILRQVQDHNEDGSYQYAYETGNGIAVQESGAQKSLGAESGTAAQGSYSYTSPEGKVVSISYVADENGFRAVGDAIPTPPPVPPAIQRALAYIAAHPQPQYVERKYY